MARRFGALGALVAIVLAVAWWLLDGENGDSVSASALLAAPQEDLSGYARAIGPREWRFPADHGPHPDFQTEWWYYTGNLKTAEGRHFGFQFTIFRRAITPSRAVSGSEWRADQVYMAHFTISDIADGRFYHDQRYSRGSAGLAGASGEPYRVWLEDWVISGQNDSATRQRIEADAGDFAIQVTLEQLKPPALQGDGGLSQKSAAVGNASYYYSLSRLATSGTIRLGEAVFEVSGTAWMDHEFSTSALGDDAQGWDWFGLYFDDNTELMIGQIRMADGRKEPAFGGLFIAADGTTRYLSAEDFSITPTRTWQSPHTGAIYPSGWDVVVRGEQTLRFTITPLMDDQELHDGGAIQYWEGAVRVEGDVSGYGYAELTGYVGTMQGRF